ncbi:MAG: Efflux transporter periplasmic adaptor subunit, partial [Bacteroidetes bacterium]|nr:Efflux transporter periplasmic adaptor subunit [Bacteroidota bacterium]
RLTPCNTRVPARVILARRNNHLQNLVVKQVSANSRILVGCRFSPTIEFMNMENQNADLSGLRINRSRGEEPSTRGFRSVLRVVVITGVVVLLVLAGYVVVPRVFDSAIEVQLATAALSSPSQANAVLTASGYVVAQRKAAVASKATGRLVSLRVVEGDKVKKGEILARIEDTDIKATLDQARANLRLYEADLKDAVQWLDRQKKLLESGVSTQADFDAAEARHRRVLASIDVAKASVVGAEVALENTLIRAPFDGTVLTKNADVGEMVAPMAASISSRSAVVTIADMGSLQTEADVSESNIERITLNQPCEITVDAYPSIRYNGYVAKIVPTADRAKATVMVKVGFKSYDSKVLPEMSAKVLFLTKASDAVQSAAKPLLTVPAGSLTTRNGKKVVFTVRENRAVEISVTVGKEFGTFVEITQGVSAGDKIIVSVSDRIENGTRVKIQ